MAQIDWEQIMNGRQQNRSRWSGANVKFLNVVRKNDQKSNEAGRDIYDEVPSISIQWPGGDETVRAIEEKDKHEFPELWEAFTAGMGEVQSGMPLKEWTRITASAVHELAYLGFRTVEQLAEANDEVRRRMGPLSQYIKEAKEWLEAASCEQAQVVAMQQQLDRERKRADKLEEQVELLMQRIEATEGIRIERVAAEPKKKGRPRKQDE